MALVPLAAVALVLLGLLLFSLVPMGLGAAGPVALTAVIGHLRP